MLLIPFYRGEAPIGITRVLGHTEAGRADRNLARLFSVSSEDAAGGTMARDFKAMHPEVRQRVSGIIEQAIGSGESADGCVDARIAHGGAAPVAAERAGSRTGSLLMYPLDGEQGIIEAIGERPNRRTDDQ